MKITKEALKRIIAEELTGLGEAEFDDETPRQRARAADLEDRIGDRYSDPSRELANKLEVVLQALKKGDSEVKLPGDVIPTDIPNALREIADSLEASEG